MSRCCWVCERWWVALSASGVCGGSERRWAGQALITRGHLGRAPANEKWLSARAGGRFR